MIESFLHHMEGSPPFRRFCERRGFSEKMTLEELPFLPVSLFKRRELISVPRNQIVRFVESSGTTSKRSRIGLDLETQMRQRKTLLGLLCDLLGPERLPWLLVGDGEMGEGVSISARAAALRGFLLAASSVTLATDESLGSFDRGVLFGLTHQLYDLALRKRVHLSNVVALHYGGWKRVKGVDRATFLAQLEESFGITQVIDLYGFTEQLGIVYADFGDGIKRIPPVSHLLIRDPYTLKVVPDGEPGLIQVLTSLPHSYPGISLLLDDVGRKVGQDAFELLGRAKGSEVRGCGS